MFETFRYQSVDARRIRKHLGELRRQAAVFEGAPPHAAVCAHPEQETYIVWDFSRGALPVDLVRIGTVREIREALKDA